jgi:hypothetical protein
MALMHDTSKVISYGIPGDCEFVEVDEIGPDGRVQTNEFETYVSWKLTGRIKTLALARQKAYGHALLPLPDEEVDDGAGGMTPNPAFKVITFDQNDVARTFLQTRFVGRTVQAMVTNMMTQGDNANDIFAAIDLRYSLKDSIDDPEAVKRRSRQALRSLQSAAPMRYMVVNHQPIEWDDIHVTEHTNIRKWLTALQDEAGAHENLLLHIKEQLQPCDEERVATAARVLEKIQSHPHLTFSYIDTEKTMWLDACTVFDGPEAAPFSAKGEYLEGKKPGYVPTFTLIYEQHAKLQQRLDDRAKAASGDVGTIKTNTKQPPSSAVVTTLPPNACYFWFHGKGTCRYGDKCKRSHDGVKGSGGVFIPRSQRGDQFDQSTWKKGKAIEAIPPTSSWKDRKKNEKGMKKKKEKNETKSSEKKKKQGCFVCDDENHRAAECPLKRALIKRRERLSKEKKGVSMIQMLGVSSSKDQKDMLDRFEGLEQSFEKLQNKIQAIENRKRKILEDNEHLLDDILSDDDDESATIAGLGENSPKKQKHTTTKVDEKDPYAAYGEYQ